MSDVLERFLEGAFSAVTLFNKAVEKRAAIEALVLAVGILDGYLRMGLVLKNQIKEGTKKIDEELLFEPKDAKGAKERVILRRAYQEGILTNELHERLLELYSRRNLCVHRYLVTDFNYDFVIKTVFEYADLIELVNARIYSLEEEQIESGRGMTIKGPIPNTALIEEMIQNKGHQDKSH